MLRFDYNMRLALFGVVLACAGVAMVATSGSVRVVGSMGYAGLAAGAIGLFLLGAGFAQSPGGETPSPPSLPEPAVLALVKARAGSIGLTLPGDDVLGPVIGHILNRKKIEAIRVLRLATGRGLKESKEAVESIARIIQDTGSH
jgi:hypothetical protein